MNPYKRAFISIHRNKVKTGLLFLIVFLLSTVISAVIWAHRGVENLERNLIAHMLPSATIQFDFDAYLEAMLRTGQGGADLTFFISEPTHLSSYQIREVGALPYVEDYYYFSRTGLNAPYKAINFGSELPPWSPSDEAFGPIFTFTGVKNPNLRDIERNVIELVNGRVFTEEEVSTLSSVALVSEEFAAINQLVVGSTITFRNIVIDRNVTVELGRYFTEEDVFASETYQLEIVGIFEPIALPNTGNPHHDSIVANNLYNTIYVPNTFVEMTRYFFIEETGNMLARDGEEIEFFNEDIMVWDNFFALRCPSYFPEFRAAVEEIISPYFLIIDNNNAFPPVLATLDTMNDLINMILIGTVGSSILILSLLLILFFRDRKNEIGIYRSLGERKGNIISQFLCEVMTVSFFAISAALFVGNIVSTRISENMLLNELYLQQQYASVNRPQFVIPTFASVAIQNEACMDTILRGFDVSLTFAATILFFSIALGTVLLGTVLPILYLLRLNPKKILL